ncbi:MAG TPA: MBL fold metallo-hydrolase [Terriglobales bacterium]|nr:MBL fold metallo-hydrolase [Terriglobales bacterium]
MNRCRRIPALLAVLALLSISSFAADNPPRTRIVMLGTGLPRPIPERSGPATAIVVDDRAYLVDFGPGVVRRASAAAAKDIPALDPKQIKVAFVTHLHSDHTAGLPDLILTPWVMGRTDLNIYGPEGTEEMVSLVMRAWHRDISIRTEGMERRPPLVVNAHDVKPGVVFKDDKVTVTAFPVAHGQWKQAFGYRFDTPDRSIVISGDTSPSEELLRSCRRCDVLIHEAYSPTAPSPPMPDWKAYAAKYHTSTSQLAEIANQTQPGLLIIYHQSDRVPDEQVLQEVRSGYKGKVVMSHDLDVY